MEILDKKDERMEKEDLIKSRIWKVSYIVKEAMINLLYMFLGFFTGMYAMRFFVLLGRW